MNIKQPSFFALRSIHKVLPKLIQPVVKKKGFSIASIILDWHQIVGEELANHCLPLKVVFRSSAENKGVLHLKVDPSVSLLLQYNEYSLIERINSFFGYKLIENFKIIQSPLERPIKQIKEKHIDLKASEKNQIDQTVKDISCSDLSLALQNLGKSIYLEKYKQKVK